MDADERKSADEAAAPPLPAPWYEKAFKIQMLFVTTTMSIGFPVFFMWVTFRPPQPPWWGKAIIVSICVLFPFAFGRLTVNMLRHLIWIFGRGPRVESWIGPPSRINCVIMGLLPVGLFDIGIGAGWPAGAFLLGMAGFGFLFSVAGFLYAQAEARKSC